MSNANDGINLERLETIGDSFLKYAITAYLYCTHHSIHEGKLSHLRSKQVSNVNLYRLGRRKKLGESMIAAKFEPHDNWLPPCYHVPLHLERALIRAGLPPSHWNGAEVPSLASLSPAQIGRVVREKGRRMMMKSISEQDSTQGGSPTLRNSCLPHLNDGNISGSYERSGRIDTQRNLGRNPGAGKKISNLDQEMRTKPCDRRSSCNLVSGSEDSNLPSRNAVGDDRMEELPCFVPYNLVTQQSIPDKSVADCVEALIGAYLIACGPRGALLFMAWLGIRVLPSQKAIVHNLRDACLNEKRERLVGCVAPKDTGGQKGDLQQKSGSCDKMYDSYTDNVGDGFEVSTSVKKELKTLLGGLNEFEKHIGYYFRDRSLLLQALTHASYSPNRLTDCYQRLEFLGDAVLDYLITRHLYEDPRQHSPGALTDLRSALVNNTIFASLAVRHGFHRFFLHLSPGLHSVVERFVRMQASNGHAICEEYYLIEEEECEEAEDVEVPKALGDVFESVAGAIFLDSGMSLDAVWKVYYRMMKAEIGKL
ncbi:hypothetical protein J437_LFUL004969 [Ladona fulva]|uniref:RNase III domain-containing protein n=1 Tax=Ladona fulva TaxID=123851 RepID=A0A8K0JVM6_LADFU|nr:hypothetical protein J437_LFUL004969 [Ladona fulva]